MPLSNRIMPKSVMSDHLKDQGIFGIPGDGDVSWKVNRWMDTEAKEACIKIFPEVKTISPNAKMVTPQGGHRLIAHIIDGGPIPKSILKEIAKKTGLPPTEIERRLRLYYKRSIEKLASDIAKTYGISRVKAKALVRLAACIHILGDWFTSKTLGLQSIRRTGTTMKKCMISFFGKEKATPYLKRLDKIFKCWIKLLSKAKAMELSEKETRAFIFAGIDKNKLTLPIEDHINRLAFLRNRIVSKKNHGSVVSGRRQVVKTRGKLQSRVARRRAPIRWRGGTLTRAGASRTLGSIGSAAMIVAPSFGGFRVGKTTMDVAVDAGVMLAGYSASQSASAMVAGTIGSGGGFAVAMVVQMVIARIAYGFYERYQTVRREQRDVGVLKARIDILNHDDGLLDRMVERAIEQKNNFN